MNCAIKAKGLAGSGATPVATVTLKSNSIFTTPHSRCALFAVGNPDVFHLVGMFEVPAAFALRIGEEIDVAAFVRPDLLQVAG